MELVSFLTSTTSKGNPNAWDISKAYYDAGAYAGDLSKAFQPVNVFKAIANEEASVSGVFFKPDGTRMYIVGFDGDEVNEYSLSSQWFVKSAAFVQSFSVSAQDTGPSDLFFKPDGTKMYITGSTGQDINEYNLSTAWNISTASYVQNFSVSAQDASPSGLFFKPDGTKMYMLGLINDRVNEYNLSTAWNISTASYVQNFSVSSQDTTPTSLSLSSDGTKMYMLGSNLDYVNEYTLSTPWDVSTASYVRRFLVSAQDTSPQGLFFDASNSSFYMAGSSFDNVFQYTIGSFNTSSQETQPYGIGFKSDGTKMYITGSGSVAVHEYNLSTAWDVTTASAVQSKSLTGQSNYLHSFYFRSDGLKFYTATFDQASGTNARVNEYSLSVAWDVSTISFVRFLSVSTKEASIYGVFFKPDGTKMYIIGTSSDSIHEYNLSTAWNISTATFNQSRSVLAQDNAPWNLFFSPDGTILYVLGQTGNDINQYSLSSAWDISTTSFIRTFSVEGQDASPTGFYWNEDGTQFWMIGLVRRMAFPYLISPT